MKAMSKLGLESAPSIHALCLIQKSQGMAIKQVRGILPEHEKDVSNIDDHIQAGSFDIEPGQAVIGLHMAEEFGLEIGDQLLIHAPDKLTDNVKWDENGELRIQEPDAVYLPEEIEIAGIFQVGVYELDLRVVYMHIDQAADLVGMDWGSATVVNARAPDPFELEPDVEKLQAQLPQYWITTWKDKNRRLFDAVQNEKTLIMFLLFFIVLVASFCISAMLITVVTQKTREIGLMKAVGYSRFMISRIFLLQGAIIGTFGTAVGVALGLLIIRFRTPLANGISRILNRQIFPQELYHLPEIPAHLTLPDLTLIACVSVLLCLFASVLPAIYEACLQPAKALQDDN
jgi:lipoprotein-releasing system permease protein